MELGLAGRVALVTAATKGLGKASALALAKEGASVAISARTRDDVERVAREIEVQTRSRVIGIVGDVGRRDDCARMVADTAAAFGALHVVVSNSGGPPPGAFEELDESQWQQAIETTLLSTVRLFRAALPHMKAAGYGRMLVITSSSVKEPIAGLLLSNVIRPGLAGLCKTLSKELGAHGITVNNVAPGTFDTDRIVHLHEKQAKAQGIAVEQTREAAKKTIPLGRFGDPNELGRVVAFLASEAGSYVSGQTLVVDGGKMASI